MKKNLIQQLNTTETNQVCGGHGEDHPHLFGLHFHELVMCGLALGTALAATYRKSPLIAGGATVTIAGIIGYQLLKPKSTHQHTHDGNTAE